MKKLILIAAVILLSINGCGKKSQKQEAVIPDTKTEKKTTPVKVKVSDMETKKATRFDIAEVYASSEKSENPAQNAFDGNPATRWESEWQVDPSWIAVRLKDKCLIEAVRIQWEYAAASRYSIEISDDGKDWTEIKSIDNGESGQKKLIEFAKPYAAKYLRILGKERTMDEYGYSIFTIEINPTILSDDKTAVFVNAEASSVQTQDVIEGSNFSAPLVIDGDLTTRWSSDFSDPQWVILEMDKETKIKAVKIKWETAAAKIYLVEVSNDKSDWKEVAKINDGKDGEERIIDFTPVSAKYIRIFAEERTHSQWGYSIYEIKAYR